MLSSYRRINSGIVLSALVASLLVSETASPVSSSSSSERAFYRITELDHYKLEDLRGKDISTQGEAILLATKKSRSRPGCLEAAILSLRSLDSTGAEVRVRVLPSDEDCMTKSQASELEGRRLYVAGRVGIVERPPVRIKRLGIIAGDIR